MVAVFFFFFQAEDGIRDLTVTGVQTCALPIFVAAVNPGSRLALYSRPNGNPVGVLSSRTVYGGPLKVQIGRGAGRGRGEISGGGGSFKKKKKKIDSRHCEYARV